MSPDIVIVAHNSGPLLAEAVASAVSQTPAGNIWVMDAESTDGSVQAIKATGVNVRSVPNRGFSASNNRGIEAGRSPFVLLLNPDAVLRPGSMDALMATAQAYPRAGIVGALLLNADGTVQTGSFGRFPSLAELSRVRVWRAWQRLRGNSTLSPQTPGATVSVDWVSGAAMLVRRQAIAEVGPLDEGFFLYYEDIDWCRRVRSVGWEVLLEPAAQVVHHLGASGGRQATAARAYRESFYRYCDLHGLWGLKLVVRWSLLLRRLSGGKT